MAKGIGADSVLVSAAYRMGMANVPKDTTKIFENQYRAIAETHKARGKMFERGIGELGKVITKGADLIAGKIKAENKQDAIDKEKAFGTKDVDQEYFGDDALQLLEVDKVEETAGKIETLSKDLTSNTANDYAKHYESGMPPPQDLINHNKTEIESYKNEIEELDNNKSIVGREKRKARKQDIYRQMQVWKDETNQRMGTYRAAVIGLNPNNKAPKPALVKLDL